MLLALDLAQGWEFREAARPPCGDEAVLTLAALDALDGERPRGAYSRFGWHHPGPLLVQQLELGLRVSGRQTSSLPWFVALGNICCILFGLLLISTERSSWLKAVLLTGTVLCFAALGRHMMPSLLLMIWNPVAALAPLFLLFCIAWRRKSAPWVLPVVAFLHAYIVQAHVGFVIIATVVAGCAALPVLRRWRLLKRPVPWALATVGTIVAVWWSLHGTWLNLAEILSFFLNRPDDGLGWSEALYLAAQRTQAGVLFLAGGRESDQLALALLGAQILILSAHAGQRLTRHRGVPWSVLRLTMGSLAVAIASSFAVDAATNHHQTHWFVIVGTFAWVGALWPLFEHRFSKVGWMLTALLMVAIVLQYQGESRERHATWRESRATQARLTSELADIIGTLGTEPPLRLEIHPWDHDLWDLTAQLAVTMDGRGHRISLAEGFRFMFGEHRTTCASPCRPVWLSRESSDGYRQLGVAHGFHVLLPLDPEEPEQPP